MFEEYLYIDYENVQDVKVEVIKPTTKVRIVVGDDQNKVPIELVQKTQPFGTGVEWIKVPGKGRNALDFFIAYFIGRDLQNAPDKKFLIYSKDTGYDPLINYLAKSGVSISRIVSFQELSTKPVPKIDDPAAKKFQDQVKKVHENLKKLAANRRPKKRRSLTGHVSSLMTGSAKKDIDRVMEELFIRKIVYEENGTIKYALNTATKEAQ